MKERKESFASIPVLAILPFKEIGVIAEGFGEGIAENLITYLSRIPELRVIPMSTSLAIKGKSPLETGSLLKATFVLNGSVSHDRDIISITVFLFETATDLNCWSRQYECNNSKVLSTLDDITFKVTEILQIQEGIKNLRGIQNIHSMDIEAYDYYQRGRRFFYQFSEHDIRLAIRMFEKAIKSDPQYALAYGGLAECYSYLFMYSPSDKRNIIHADQSSKVAITLDPFLADAWSSRGVVLSLQKKYLEAEDCFEKAMALDPMLFDAPYQYARMSFTQGFLLKAITLYTKAAEIRPDDYQAPLLSAQSYDVLGLHEKAIEMRKKGIDNAKKNLKYNPGDTRALSLAANGLVALGKHEKATEFLERALALEPEDPMLSYNAGCIYALMGRKEEALDCLEKASKTGLTQKEWYIHDDNLDSIRNMSRFKKILEGMA